MNDFLEHLSPEELASLRSTFFTQASELLEALNEGLLRLETTTDQAEELKAIQRAVHTLKGDSASFGMDRVATLAHRMEDLLGLIREDQIAPDPATVDLLLEATDTLGTLVNAYGDGLEPPEPSQLLERIAAVSGPVTAPESEPALPTEAPDPQPGTPQVDTDRSMGADGQRCYEIRVTFDPQCQLHSAGAFLLTQHLSPWAEILGAEPHLDSPDLDRKGTLTFIVTSAHQPEALKAACEIPGVSGTVSIKLHEGNGRPTERTETGSATTPSATIRVDAGRVDKVMNLVGELTIARSMFTRALHHVEERLGRQESFMRLGEANNLMERTMSDLQKSVLRMRMVPIDTVFRRLPRIVRDLARSSDKEVRLVIAGQGTELDKGIVDRIGEPLLHLIRNAVDHGIEPPTVREASGKPRTGTVQVNAFHEGNQIIIELEDDGKGIDAAAVWAKAVEKGLIDAAGAEQLSEAQILDLIFLSGFSTATTVTDVSGRGIGMDVVRATLQELKGSIKMTSRPGLGTKMTLRLPLTLAIIKAMLFTEGDQLFALPLDTIGEIARIQPTAIETVEGREVLRIRDRVISLLRLSSLLAIAAGGSREHRFVLILSLGERRVGLLVEHLAGEEELVIKAMEGGWVSTDLVAGASLLGDGQVILILNPSALVEHALGQERDRRRLNPV